MDAPTPQGSDSKKTYLDDPTEAFSPLREPAGSSAGADPDATEILAPTAAVSAPEGDKLASQSTESQQGDGIGSKVFFIGSALLAGGVIVAAATFLLPLNDSAEQPVNGSSSPTEVATAPAETSPETDASTPTPSFNTKSPTITERDGETEGVVIPPGSVQYAPTEQSFQTQTTYEEAPAPTETTAVNENPPTVEETVPAPTDPAPADSIAPTDSSPTYEPDSPAETLVPSADAVGDDAAAPATDPTNEAPPAP